MLLGFRNPTFIVQLATVLLFLVAIFFSFRAVRLTQELHRRAHVYILIALLFALFVVAASICGLESIGNIPTANVGNIFSALFFVLGFTLYAKILKRAITMDDTPSAQTKTPPPVTNASGDIIRQ